MDTTTQRKVKVGDRIRICLNASEVFWDKIDETFRLMSTSGRWEGAALLAILDAVVYIVQGLVKRGRKWLPVIADRRGARVVESWIQVP